MSDKKIIKLVIAILLSLVLLVLIFSLRHKISRKIKNNIERTVKKTVKKTDKNKKVKSINISKKSKNQTSPNYYYENIDSIVRAVCDTSYFVKPDTIKLVTDTCPFKPFLLLNTNKLLIYNQSLDSVYKIPFSKPLFKAVISPFDKNELYVFLKDYLPEKFSSYIEKQPFNLLIYKLNLEKMEMIKEAVLYNFSYQLSKKSKYGEYCSSCGFFNDSVKFDINNKKLYLNCVEYIDDPDYYPISLRTYIVDLKKHSVDLSNIQKKAMRNNQGILLKFSSSYDNMLKISGNKVEIFEKNGDILDFPKDIFKYCKDIVFNDYISPQSIYDLKEDTLYKRITFDFYKTKDNKYSVCSAFNIEDMDQCYGDIYLVDNTDLTFKYLKKNISFWRDFYSLYKVYSVESKYYFLSYDFELNIYDKNFKEIQSFKNVKFYELF